MRIQLASDLHLEFLRDQFPDEFVISPVPDADLLVLAGDIANGVDGVRMFADWPVPVLYLIGNHELYGRVLDEARQAMRRATKGISVVLLDNERADFSPFWDWATRHALELKHIRFLGCTLWTTYQLPNAALSGRRAMDYAEEHLTDHRIIQTASGAPFSPRDALREHEASVSWLREELERPFDGKTVVITHHAPHVGSIHPRFAGNFLNPAFASQLPTLMMHADVWMHNHTHDSFD